MKTSLCFAAALILTALAVAAQPYSIDWYKVSGGGGTSTNGQFTLSGTVGQADAGGPLTNGQFSLTGGFWAITAVQTPGAPLLTIRNSGANSVIASWPSPSTGFVLQKSINIATPGWINFSGTTNDDGTNKSVTIQPPTGNLFFRLMK